MTFQKIVLCLDMAGCPNRCLHCWLGHDGNANLPLSEFAAAAESFRPFTRCLEVVDWYREPDYRDDYRERSALCGQLSDEVTPHYELASVWRLARDPSYAPWLYGQGVRAVQLTLFGGEALTDRYTGRKGAYRDILAAVEILIQHKIAPRFQFFVNQETVKGLPEVEGLIGQLKLDKRCETLEKPFEFFLHGGSCDGANEALYPLLAVKGTLSQIPESLVERTLRYFGKKTLDEVFGEPEAALFARLKSSEDVEGLANDKPVFFLDHRFDLYPNFTAPAPFWRLGNLKEEGAEPLLRRFLENASPAQHARLTVPLGEMVQKAGAPDGQGLFIESDYIDYILNRYCRGMAGLPAGRAL